MRFEEGFKKVISYIPEEMEIISEDNEPCFEIKIGSDLKPTGQICFALQSKKNTLKMNIKVDQEGKLLEAYPITHSKKDRHQFHLKADEIKEGTTYYLSLNMKEDRKPEDQIITHIYYISKKTGNLTRRDREGNEREYSQYMFYSDELKELYGKYHPAYVFSYHPVGHPESPTAYLLGFNKYCPKYNDLKANLFQLINNNID